MEAAPVVARVASPRRRWRRPVAGWSFIALSCPLLPWWLRQPVARVTQPKNGGATPPLRFAAITLWSGCRLLRLTEARPGYCSAKEYPDQVFPPDQGLL
jgi:hypothetical protein